MCSSKTSVPCKAKELDKFLSAMHNFAVQVPRDPGVPAQRQLLRLLESLEHLCLDTLA